jgi:hypothetical protein
MPERARAFPSRQRRSNSAEWYATKSCWCPGAELNHRHRDFQSRALPTELPGRRAAPLRRGLGKAGAVIGAKGRQCPARGAERAVPRQPVSSSRSPASALASSSTTGTA